MYRCHFSKAGFSSEIPKFKCPRNGCTMLLSHALSLILQRSYFVDSHSSKHQPNKQLDMGEMEALLKQKIWAKALVVYKYGCFWQSTEPLQALFLYFHWLIIPNSKSHDENKMKKHLTHFNVNFDKYVIYYYMIDIVQAKGSYCNRVVTILCWNSCFLDKENINYFVHAKARKRIKSQLFK